MNHGGVSPTKTNGGCSAQWAIYFSLNVNPNIHHPPLLHPATPSPIDLFFLHSLLWFTHYPHERQPGWRGCSPCFCTCCPHGWEAGRRWRDDGHWVTRNFSWVWKSACHCSYGLHYGRSCVSNDLVILSLPLKASYSVWSFVMFPMFVQSQRLWLSNFIVLHQQNSHSQAQH